MTKTRFSRFSHPSEVAIPQSNLKVSSISWYKQSLDSSINNTTETVNRLEGTAYYQSSYIVEDYLDKF